VSQVIVLMALVFSVLIAIFAVQNTQEVDVRFLGWGATGVAASVLVLISAVAGAVAMLLLGVAREVGLRWQHRTTSNQLRVAQKRVAELEAAQPSTATTLTPGPSDAAPPPAPTRPSSA
jgi:lipopolysaccharide assembly protein A